MPTAEERKILQRMKKTSKGAYKKSRTKEPKVKGQQLPGGINKGVARFSDYKLGLDKNNNPYIMLTGIVISPEEHAGARATRSHFLTESEYRSLQERYDDLFSDLQLLRINTAEMDEASVLEECLAQLDAIKEEKRPFYFNTWKRNQESDTIVFFQEGDPGDDVGDTEPEEEEEEEVEDEEEEEEDEYLDEEIEDEEEGEDEEVEEEDEDDEEEDEDDEEEDGEWEPEKGDIYAYAINSKATPYPCSVTSVNRSRHTVSLKREKDGKLFKDISWDKLQDVEEE